MKIGFSRISFWGCVAAIIWTLGIYATVVRFFYGLGAATHLSDSVPWGLWIGLDILVGVGLAAGGFFITAMVYLFNLKEYQPIVRPAILTSFLGYGLVIITLLFDLGKPYHIWRPIVMWNHHSVMFEVGWCVLLYTLVLFFEFSPMALERLGLKKPLSLMTRSIPFLVMSGVLLSTLHQSSLGSLYLLVPDKMHPLWYSPLLPFLFFSSAVAAGLAMVIFESYLSSRAFGRALEFSLLVRLSRILVPVVLLYGIIRFKDLAGRGVLGAAFSGSQESLLFMAEVLFGLVLPIIVFSIPAWRNQRAGLFLGAVLVLLGFILNRLNVSITALVGSADVEYTPSWMEWAITASMAAAGVAVFRLAVKHLPVFTHQDTQAKQVNPPLLEPGQAGAGVMAGLGGLLFLLLMALLFGLNRKQAAAKSLDGEAKPLSASAVLRLPAAIVFEPDEASPGRVTFHHQTHVDPTRPGCVSCHATTFRIRPIKSGQAGTVKMDSLYAGKQCGICHNGEQAFRADEECENCHSGR
ncbi:MAG TPA: Ni/Fe-hydrogenase cytochrome b subunit [bacterium]|nr:Ni/Fe-hydrogenase cytochrome b subunit [bacterium]HPN34287.1 Ni/Fe-hydrogenase cytochrome b subunit [bacterium]